MAGLMHNVANELNLTLLPCYRPDRIKSSAEEKNIPFGEGVFHCHDASGLKYNSAMDALMPGAAKMATVQEPFLHGISSWFQFAKLRRGTLDEHLITMCDKGGEQTNALKRKPGQTVQEVMQEYDVLIPTPFIHTAVSYAISVIGRCWPPRSLLTHLAANHNAHRESNFTYESLPQWHNATLRSVVKSKCADDYELYNWANTTFHRTKDQVHAALDSAWKSFQMMALRTKHQ